MNPAGPLVFVGGVNVLEGFGYVAGIKPDQRILPHLRSPDGFDPDLIDGSLTPLLFWCRLLERERGGKRLPKKPKELQPKDDYSFS